ncbi:MAG: VCBS repeat-containing protein, partial [Bacteroidota bacterium]
MRENKDAKTQIERSLAHRTSPSAIWLLGLWSLMMFSCETSPVALPLFRLLPPSQSGIDFVNQVEDGAEMNIIQYLYFYNGGGVAIGDLNNDGLADIYFSANMESNRLYLNQGNLTFEEITESAAVGGEGNWSTGVSMVDINADGWLDIYVCQVGNYKEFAGKNQLFLNQGKEGSPKFVEVAEEYGLDESGFSTQAAFLDYDQDGDLDMYLLKHSVHSTESYRDTSYTRKRHEQAGDKLFRNDVSDNPEPGKYFVDVSEEAGILGGIAGYGLGVAVGDVDKNGCPDLYISNDFHENDFLYLNNCDGTFSERASESLGHTSNFSMGNDVADINNDQWLDVVSMDMKPDDEVIYKNSAGIDPYDIYQFKRTYGYDHQFPRNMLQLNQGKLGKGSLRFSEVGEYAGIAATDWSWGALILDVNNDRLKDLFITNGIVRRPNDLDYLNYIGDQQVQAAATDLELAEKMPEGSANNQLFINQGELRFKESSRLLGRGEKSISNGSAFADLDLDGDLDLVVNNLNETAFVYENLSNEQLSNHFLSIRLKGPPHNPFGIGASVTIYEEGGIQYQEMYPVRAWQSSSDYRCHIGVGTSILVDSMRIRWGDGKTQLLTDIAVDQNLIVEYQQALHEERIIQSPGTSPLFVDVSEEVNVPFFHQENLFFDNKRETLIPYLLSTQGPKIAVGDVNGDQLEDLFIGGASKQGGALLIQNANGSLSRSGTEVFDQDSMQEDTGLSLFDADQDGDLDLYIGSGGNQYYHQHEGLKDRLYLNDGQGNFTKSAKLPEFFNQTSCVKAA